MSAHRHRWDLIAFGIEGCRGCSARREAIAMEARQGTDPQGLDGEAATARVRKDIAQ